MINTTRNRNSNMNGREKIILVTAFEAFDGETLNPTERILEELPDEAAGFTIRKLLLPVEFVRALELAVYEYDQLAPAAVIMLGQAGGRSAITPETTGRNIMNGRIPDNAGFRPERLPVKKSGPAELKATLPVERIVQAVRELGIACEKSDDAGEYVCNTLLYGMLHHVNGTVPAGFIHVPYIREQGHAEAPFMEPSDLRRGILAAIQAVAEEAILQDCVLPE